MKISAQVVELDGTIPPSTQRNPFHPFAVALKQQTQKVTQWCAALIWPDKVLPNLKTLYSIHNRTEKTWFWQHALVIITFLWASHHEQGIWKEIIAYPNIWAFEKISDHISICVYFHKSLPSLSSVPASRYLCPQNLHL